MAAEKTPDDLRKQAKKLIQQSKELEKEKPPKVLKTFSHIIMFCIMLMYFVGVGLGAYATVLGGEDVGTTLDYIMELSYLVALGYFSKAFGENALKIVMPYVGKKKNSNNNSGSSYYGGYSSYSNYTDYSSVDTSGIVDLEDGI
jgi:hypothetical protein